MDYRSILNNSEVTYKIKRSEFIGNAFHVKTEEEAKERIKEVSNNYKNATHNCWAYKVNEKFNYSDNGEPSGTAGKPIFGAIEKYNLNNIVVVVTRYFGGIKLGVRGLIDAYSKTADMVILNSKIVEYKTSILYKVETDYTRYAEIERMLKRYEGWKIKDQEFSDIVIFKISVFESKEILNILENKSKKLIKTGTEEIPIEVKI